MIGMYFLLFNMCFSIVFVHLLNVVIRIFRAWEVHTHQFDVVTVYHNRGTDGVSHNSAGSCIHVSFNKIARHL